jgi:hypothetical protein
MQWFDVNMSGCEQGPGDPCFFDDDPVRVYMASEVEAHISELESAAVASALRVKELEKALRQIDSGLTEDGWILGSAEMQQIARSALMEKGSITSPACGFGPCVIVEGEEWHDPHCPSLGKGGEV